MESEREVCNDAEVSTTAPKRPEQLGIFVVRRPVNGSVRGDDRRGDQVVQRESIQAGQVPQPTAERQTCNASVAERAAGCREPMTLAGGIEILPEHSSTARRRSRVHVDGHVAHQP